MLKKICLLVIFKSFIVTFIHALPHPDHDPRVQKIYDHLQGQLAWIQNGAWTPCGKILLDVISRADEDGLWAADYIPFIDGLRKAELLTPESQKAADALLTLAVLNYIADIKGKRLNPCHTSKDIYVKQIPIDETEILKTSLSLSNDCEWVYNLPPSSHEYQRLKQLLSLYRQKKSQETWPQLPKGTKLQKGDRGPLVEILKSQLRTQDLLSFETQNHDIFDEALEEVVRTYQDLHGLEKDGIVGGATLAALNTSIESRIRSIIISMERHRWLPNPLPSRYILVNVPGFYLKAVDAGEPVFFMPIITGQEHKKTPIFNASLTEVVFNPAWHVPPSIIAEMLPSFQRNPQGYAAKGYHFYNNFGQEVNPSSLSGGGLRVVQSPGSTNALGKIRFTLDSPFSIYLHGTPNEHLFKKGKRSLSHGCIRVQDPYKLALFVLQDLAKWPLAHIQLEASGTKTKRVKLEHPVPVFITYFTVFEDENHNMHFVEDEYQQDKHVWLALEKAKRKESEKQEIHPSLLAETQE